MQKYSLQFKGLDKVLYDIRIYIDGYVGPTNELIGARSPFTIMIEDDSYIYKPVRISTATLNLKDKNIRADLFSTNMQAVPIKLYHSEKLKWTGYIKAEQFTQPYTAETGSFSVDCISAISSLENVIYKKQTSDGFITANNLLYYLLSSAKGGYKSVYIPHVYSDSPEHYIGNDDVLARITLLEENFISKEMNLLEVLENLMKFFSWSLWDCEGSIYIVDADWDGEYLHYKLENEALAFKEKVNINSILLQDIGFQGANHTLDILPGYNKVTVKAVNNVFDSVFDEEDLEKDEYIGEFRSSKKEKRVYKKFVKPSNWKVITRDMLGRELAEGVTLADPNTHAMSAILVRKSDYSVTIVNGNEYPDVSEYSWTDCIQMRSYDWGTSNWVLEDAQYPAVIIKGVNAIWKNCAISISFNVLASLSPLDYNLAFFSTSKKDHEYNLTFKLRIGKNYWDGAQWVNTECTFPLLFQGKEPNLSVVNRKTPDIPYSGLRGYLIQFPEDRMLKGDFELTLYNYKKETHATGILITNFKVGYAKKDNEDTTGENGDRVYENKINENNQSELEEVEFGISSYNSDGSTYSKALLNDDFLTNNLYSQLEKKKIRPEDGFIRRACGRYEQPQIKLTQEITASQEIHPFTIMYDKTMVNKKFRILSYSWEVQRNKISLSMVEDGDKGS